MLYIYYPVFFYIHNIKILLNLNSKIDVIYLVCTNKLCFFIYNINIRAQKINRSILEIFKIMMANFLLLIKLKRLNFLGKVFY